MTNVDSEDFISELCDKHRPNPISSRQSSYLNGQNVRNVARILSIQMKMNEQSNDLLVGGQWTLELYVISSKQINCRTLLNVYWNNLLLFV